MKNNGRSISKKKPILPPTYLLASIVAMALLRFLLPGVQIIALPWTLLGLLPAAAGIALNLAADGALKQHSTTVKPFEKSTSLVTHSAYAFSRHPMYLGFTSILLGLAVFLGTLTPFIVVLVFGVLMEFVFIRVEEPMMEEAFGEAWRTYKAKVRRWI